MLFLRTILLDSLRGGEKWFKGSEGDFIPSKIGNQCTVFVKKCTNFTELRPSVIRRIRLRSSDEYRVTLLYFFCCRDGVARGCLCNRLSDIDNDGL